jgi:hypothetical protein
MPTRRQVVTGIAGASIAAAFGCGREQQKSIDSARPSVAISTLNVVIHGLAVMVISKSGAATGIQLVFPQITSADPDMSHRYWFGSLGNIVGSELDQMKPIAPLGVCTLGGVTPGSRPSANSFTADLLFPNASVDTTRCRQFFLPWTDKVRSVALVQRKDGAKLLTDNCGTSYGNVFKLSTICVLTYPLANSDAPAITYDDGSDTGWTVKPSASRPDYANLHIFAEPKRADSQHAIGAFSTLMGTIGKSCLTFDPFPDDDMSPIPDNNPPTGTSAALDLRHLANFFRAGETANCIRAVVCC